MLGLQDILSNKQTRGAFGEIQLREIVTRALPPDVVTFQATLSNGTRADCLIHLPQPPGPIVIDAKFPLEAYEALRAAKTPAEVQAAQRLMRGAVRAHMRAIAEKYVIEGETAEGALMFLPSEAVYAELHASFGDLVREGFGLRVWIVSPTTCMATLHTLRAVLKDARLRAEAHAIRRELGLLHRDVERLRQRVGNLDRHFAQAQKDVEEIRISADKARARARRLEAIDFAPEASVRRTGPPQAARAEPIAAAAVRCGTVAGPSASSRTSGESAMAQLALDDYPDRYRAGERAARAAVPRARGALPRGAISRSSSRRTPPTATARRTGRTSRRCSTATARRIRRRARATIPGRSGAGFLKWEMHTEFVTYTLFADGRGPTAVYGRDVRRSSPPTGWRRRRARS